MVVRNVVKQGFVLLLPIGIAFFIIKFFFDTLDGVPQPIIEAVVGYRIPGLGLLIILFLSFLLGLVVATVMGRSAYSRVESAMGYIPLFGSVYDTAKMVVSSSYGNGDAGAFKHIVMVEYPSPGITSIGFVTRHVGEDKVMVYIPSTPVPNTGIIVIVPKEKTTRLAITAGEALKIIATAGVVMPKGGLRVTKP
jgi:uncharacterized membrane protein